MITPNKFTEPNKELENLYTSIYLNRQPLNESVQTETEVSDGDDGLGIEDSEFDTLFESILGTDVVSEEFEADTEVGAGEDPSVSPQGGDDFSEFDDEGGEEGEEETVAIPVSQLRPLYDLLSAHFGGEPDGDEGVDGGEDDILQADDQENFDNDQMPTEAVKTKKKFIDSKLTGFQTRTKVPNPKVKPVKFDKSPKTHKTKSKLMKSQDKNWV